LLIFFHVVPAFLSQYYYDNLFTNNDRVIENKMMIKGSQAKATMER